MPGYHIGTLDDAGKGAVSGEESESAAPDDSPIFLQPKTWKKALLSTKTTVSWDTRIFTFSLSSESQQLGLPTGQHLMIRLRDPVTREAIIRSYTPVSEHNDQGKVDVLVKVYFDSPEKPGGKMSQALEQLPIGHFVEIKGPIGKFEYLGAGACKVQSQLRQVKRFIMICGGSGVTPIYQVLRAVVREGDANVRCIVLNGNRLEEDILCREDLDDYSERYKHKCDIVHTLSGGGPGWKGLRGRIGKELLTQYASKEVVLRDGVEEGEVMILICGPEAMEKSSHKELLAIGWKDDDILFF